jgi:hypothetical protein
MINLNSIENLSSGEFWGFLIFPAAASLFCLWSFIRYLRFVRLIEDTPTSKIRSAAQGFIELEGRGVLIPQATIASPLSGSVCIWYRYKIERKVVNGKNTHWRTIQSGSSPHPIRIDDTTGQCLLAQKGASIHTHLKKSWYGMSATPSTMSIDRSNSLMQFGNYRYTEELIPENTPLYALGHFKTVRSTDNFQQQKAVARIISDWKADYEYLLAKFDRNNDGLLDEKEWKLVRLAAKLEADDLRKELLNEAEIHTMEKPVKGLPYLISTGEQDSFANKFKWYSRLAFVAFVFSGYSSVWLIQARLSAQSL